MSHPLQEKFSSLVGQEFYLSERVLISQQDINNFANATGDHQWIHLDQERAKKESPWGETVAHGFLTLALCSRLLAPAFADMKLTQVLNYGCEKVRFPEAVRSGDEVRGRFHLLAVEPGPMGGLKLKFKALIEIEGREKPGCAAEIVFIIFS